MADLVFRKRLPVDTGLTFGEADSGGGGSTARTLSGALTLFNVRIEGEVANDINVTRGIFSAARSGWDDGARVTQSAQAAYGRSLKVMQSVAEGWEPARLISVGIHDGWGRPLRVVSQDVSRWKAATSVLLSVSAHWFRPNTRYFSSSVAWDDARDCVSDAAERYRYAPSLQAAQHVHWDPAIQRSRRVAGRYNDAVSRLISSRVVWERAGYPSPGLSVIPDPVDPTVPQLPPGVPVDLVFSEQWSPLLHRALVFGADTQPPINVFPKVYMLMPTVNLYALPSGDELAAIDAVWSTDLDSWGWQFSATLKRPSDIERVKPSASGLVAVRCVINGYAFTGWVESYRHTRSHGVNTYTISGTSLSAELSEPFIQKSAGLVDTALNARQIAESLLLNTGWTLDWQTVDWLVPANTFSWDRLDPMGVLAQLADSVGAVVQSHVSERTLRVIPRYPVSPWHWDDPATTVATALPESLIASMGADYVKRPEFNGAIVAGGANGVIVRATRDGTAGEVSAGIFVDDLITHVDAGRERARIELCKAGAWEEINATGWLTSAGEGPGLILPGSLIEVVGIQGNYRTLVNGVSVAMRSSIDALTVRQSITAEKRYA